MPLDQVVVRESPPRQTVRRPCVTILGEMLRPTILRRPLARVIWHRLSGREQVNALPCPARSVPRVPAESIFGAERNASGYQHFVDQAVTDDLIQLVLH